MASTSTSAEFPKGYAELAETLSTHKLYLIHRTSEPQAAEVVRDVWQPHGQPSRRVTLEQAIESDPNPETPPLDHAWIGSQEWRIIAHYTLPGVEGFVGWQLLAPDEVPR